MTDHKIGTREEWLAARLELLEDEKELTRRGDELARRRRELPWVRVEEEYRFDTDDGTRTLGELFDGRVNCSSTTSCSARATRRVARRARRWPTPSTAPLPHLHARDVTLTYVSQAPLQKLQAYKRRMGWNMPWVSSAVDDFNFDLGYSFTEEQAREAIAPMLEAGDPSDCRAQRELERHRRHGLPHPEPGLQRIRPRRRHRVPDLRDRRPRRRVPDGLLRDPRPGAEGAGRGRRGCRCGSAGTTSTGRGRRRRLEGDVEAQARNQRPGGLKGRVRLHARTACPLSAPLRGVPHGEDGRAHDAWTSSDLRAGPPRFTPRHSRANQALVDPLRMIETTVGDVQSRSGSLGVARPVTVGRSGSLDDVSSNVWKRTYWGAEVVLRPRTSGDRPRRLGDPRGAHGTREHLERDDRSLRREPHPRRTRRILGSTTGPASRDAGLALRQLGPSLRGCPPIHSGPSRASSTVKVHCCEATARSVRLITRNERTAPALSPTQSEGHPFL